jgi:hypothetical protein
MVIPAVDVLFKETLKERIKFYCYMPRPTTKRLQGLDFRYHFCAPTFYANPSSIPITDKTRNDITLYICSNLATFDLHILFPAATWMLFFVHNSVYTNEMKQRLLQYKRKRNIAFVFPSQHKQDEFAGWFPLHDTPSVVIHHSLLPIFFDSFDSTISRNNRILLLCNNIDNRLKLYPDSSRILEPILHAWAHNIDLVGRATTLKSNKELFLSTLYSHFETNMSNLRPYSTAIFPLLHPSPGFNIIESLALGIPVITTERETLPKKYSNAAYFIANTGEEFNYYINNVLTDAGVCQRISASGHLFAKTHFHSEQWAIKLTSFLKSL